jgi:hypothetical protein
MSKKRKATLEQTRDTWPVEIYEYLQLKARSSEHWKHMKEYSKLASSLLPMIQPYVQSQDSKKILYSPINEQELAELGPSATLRITKTTSYENINSSATLVRLCIEFSKQLMQTDSQELDETQEMRAKIFGTKMAKWMWSKRKIVSSEDTIKKDNIKSKEHNKEQSKQNYHIRKKRKPNPSMQDFSMKSIKKSNPLQSFLNS